MCRLWNGEFHGGSLPESDLFIDPWRREKEEGLSRGRSRIVVQLCRGPCCFNGRAATRMVLLNGHQTWWGARPLYPSLNPLWPVIGCRVTKGRRCDFGQEAPMRGLCWELSAASTPSRRGCECLGSEGRIWTAHHDTTTEEARVLSLECMKE